MGVPGICQDIAWTNWGQVGQCFTQIGSFGDLALAGLLLSVLFLLVMVRYNLPLFLLLPMSWVLSWTLWLLSGGATIFLAFFLLSTMLNGAVLIIAILNYLNR